MGPIDQVVQDPHGKEYLLIRQFSVRKRGTVEVYLAVSPADQRPCVVKRGTGSAARRLLHEAAVHYTHQEQASRSPHLVRVTDGFLASDGSYNLVLEPLDGSLLDLFDSPHYCGSEWLLSVARPVLHCLAALHCDGDTHGDISVENVLYSYLPGQQGIPSAYTFKLADLGQTVRWDDGDEREYPERLRDDLESAAELLVEVWHGCELFGSNETRKALERVPGELQLVIRKAMDRGFEGQDAALEVLRGLEAAKLLG